MSGTNAYSNASLAQRLNDGKGSVRVDAQTTRFGTLAAYYFIDNYNLNNPYPTQQGGANVPGFNALSNGRSQLASLSDTKTFGPTLVNDIPAQLYARFQQPRPAARRGGSEPRVTGIHRRHSTALFLEIQRPRVSNPLSSTKSISGQIPSRWCKPTAAIRRRTTCPK